MSQSSFIHQQHAHCESGVTANLLRHAGLPISEPMAFGIGAGMFFGHLPMLKVNGVPGTTYRIWPGAIFKRVTQRLGVTTHAERFRNPAKAMQALDDALAAGRPTGVLGSVYFLPYLPEAFRFHFNAHNLVVYGKEDGRYLVSDPIMEDVTTIESADLEKCRFAKGFPEPKGYMYYVTGATPQPDMAKAIKEGIQQTCSFMFAPPPWFGLNGIFYLARRIEEYPRKLTPRQATLYLGNIIRMQEEIGTGGGGFRYLYAAFLQEAGQLLHRDDLLQYSRDLTAIGDQWRNFAYSAARIMKARSTEVVSYHDLSELLRQCGQNERELFGKMKKMKW